VAVELVETKLAGPGSRSPDLSKLAPEVFDAMMASLLVPDESAALATLAKLPRRIGR
jgi:hypothetical protein